MIIQKTDNISGVVLAGGDSKRFGGINKANIQIGGEKIITRIINTLEKIFEEIIIVTNAPADFAEFSRLKVIRDHFLKVGPLGGIHAAMKASTKNAVFIFAGDMPYLNKELIISQIEYFNSGSAEAVLPEINKRLEPLHAIYRNLICSRLEVYLSGGSEFAIRDFLENADVSLFRINLTAETIKAFTNINTPSEAQRVINDSEI